MRTAIIRGLLLLVALQSDAWAVCGLPQPRLVCQEYFAKPVVVVAKLMRMRAVTRDDEAIGSDYYMEVVERLKGRILRRFRVYEENGSGRAPFEWKRGENYLLFLSYSEENRRWELDGCGNSAPFASAKKVLDGIARIRTGKERSRIEGFIASEETLPARVTVRIEGGGRTHIVTVENREFKMRVAPGTYTVTPVAAGWTFTKDEFSYDDPQKITIQPGRCAQIQFQAKPK